MSTIRNIERRMFIRRQTDRDLAGSASAGVAAPRPGHRALEWNGIWAGYLIWAGVEVILLGLVLGIGFSSLNPLRASSWAGVGRGVVIWAAIVTFIATYIGSWVAGRTPMTTKGHGIAKGIVLWGMIMLSMVLIVGWVAGQAVNVAAGAASGITSAAPTAANTGITALQGALQSNGITLPRAQVADIGARLAAGDRTGAATTLSTDANIPPARATSIIEQVGGGGAAGPLSQAGSAAGRAARTGGSSLSWGIFWTALITLGCAIGGGATGGGGGGLRPLSKQPAQAA